MHAIDRQVLVTATLNLGTVRFYPRKMSSLASYIRLVMLD